METVDLYTKPGCCLCDDAKAVLSRVQADIPFELRVIDIETDAALLERYGEQIPVVFVGGFKAFKFHVDEDQLRRKLARSAASAASAASADGTVGTVGTVGKART